MDIPPGSKQRIYSWFQNSVGVVAAILLVVIAVSIGATKAVDAAERIVGRVATVVVSLVAATGFGVLAIRSARIGVYWRPGGILIRGLIGIFVVDREDIRDVQVGRFGQNRTSYCACILLVPSPGVSLMLTEEPAPTDTSSHSGGSVPPPRRAPTGGSTNSKQ